MWILCDLDDCVAREVNLLLKRVEAQSVPDVVTANNRQPRFCDRRYHAQVATTCTLAIRSQVPLNEALSDLAQRHRNQDRQASVREGLTVIVESRKSLRLT